MSVYVILSSDKSLNYFPNNKLFKFKSHLNSPLILNGKWKVALLESDIASSSSISKAVYLYSNVCGESTVEGEQKPLFQRLMASSPGNWSSIFETPHQVPVKIKEISSIEIFITNDQHE